MNIDREYHELNKDLNKQNSEQKSPYKMTTEELAEELKEFDPKVMKSETATNCFHFDRDTTFTDVFVLGSDFTSDDFKGKSYGSILDMLVNSDYKWSSLIIKDGLLRVEFVYSFIDYSNNQVVGRCHYITLQRPACEVTLGNPT